jgi:hypothetical protein
VFSEQVSVGAMFSEQISVGAMFSEQVSVGAVFSEQVCRCNDWSMCLIFIWDILYFYSVWVVVGNCLNFVSSLYFHIPFDII